MLVHVSNNKNGMVRCVVVRQNNKGDCDHSPTTGRGCSRQRGNPTVAYISRATSLIRLVELGTREDCELQHGG